MSRRLHAVFLITLLMAAQVGVLNHALEHTLRGDVGSCFLCHSADQFKHSLNVNNAAGTPLKVGCIELTPALDPAPCIAVTRAFLARAPPHIFG